MKEKDYYNDLSYVEGLLTNITYDESNRTYKQDFINISPMPRFSFQQFGRYDSPLYTILDNPVACTIDTIKSTQNFSHIFNKSSVNILKMLRTYSLKSLAFVVEEDYNVSRVFAGGQGQNFDFFVKEDQ